MYAPLIPAGSARFRRVTICGIVARHSVAFATFNKGYIQTVIEKGVRCGVLAGIRSAESKCNLVPLPLLAGDTYSIPDAGADGNCRDNQDEDNRFRFGFRLFILIYGKV